jgi:hypothetical protein
LYRCIVDQYIQRTKPLSGRLNGSLAVNFTRHIGLDKHDIVILRIRICSDIGAYNVSLSPRETTANGEPNSITATGD